jgi:hypothetical protein
VPVAEARRRSNGAAAKCWMGRLVICFRSEETQLSRNHTRNKPAESPWFVRSGRSPSVLHVVGEEMLCRGRLTRSIQLLRETLVELTIERRVRSGRMTL